VAITIYKRDKLELSFKAKNELKNKINNEVSFDLKQESEDTKK